MPAREGLDPLHQALPEGSKGPSAPSTMAHSKQAKKRLRQAEKHRIHNRSVKREIKTLTKRFVFSIEDGDKKEADALFRAITSKLDKAAKNHIYHRNTVARRKSHVATLYKKLGAS